MRDRNLQVAMCGSKLQCVCANPFWLKLAMCVRLVHFWACEVQLLLYTFLAIYALSFGVNYNSVSQKLRILTIKAIFDQKIHF